MPAHRKNLGTERSRERGRFRMGSWSIQPVIPDFSSPHLTRGGGEKPLLSHASDLAGRGLLPAECFSKRDPELSHTSLPLQHSFIPPRHKDLYLHPALQEKKKKKSIKPAALENKPLFPARANNLLLFQVLLGLLSRAARSPLGEERRTQARRISSPLGLLMSKAEVSNKRLKAPWWPWRVPHLAWISVLNTF